MRKSIWNVITVIGCFFWATSVCNANASQPENGDGSKDNPYQITNYDELCWFRDYVNQGGDNTKACAILTKNIVCDCGEKNQWSPIGYIIPYETVVFYQGTFDGKGFVISGLYCDNTGLSCVGLFGANQGTIQNVGVVDSYFNGEDYIGGICGYNYSKIYNCYNNSVVSGRNYVGGVCGYTTGSTISDCYSIGSVFSQGNAGGISGYVFESTVSNCYSVGYVLGQGYVGGVFGYINKYTISNCYYAKGICNLSNAKGIGGDADDIKGLSIKELLKFKFDSDKWNDGFINDASITFPSVKGVDTAYTIPFVDNYLQISTVEDLYVFASLVENGYNTLNAKLINDIVVNSNVLTNGELNGDGSNFSTWIPIGSGVNYEGTFDGNNKTISGVYVNDPNLSKAGLFGGIENYAVVKNLKVVDSYVNAKDSVGGIAGSNESGTILCCSFSGCVIGNSQVGGISGFNSYQIENCYNTGSVTGGEYVGGLVGNNTSNRHGWRPNVKNCYNSGLVGGTTNVGGVAGYNHTYSYISNTYFDITVDSILSSNENNCGKTTAEFKSGAIAVALGDAWGQKIGKEDYPIFNSTPVYANTCGGVAYQFTNNYDESIDESKNFAEHDYDENGFCTRCGTFNHDENGYYLISNYDQLKWFADQVNNGNLIIKGKLVKDIIVNQNVLGENNANVNEDGTYNTEANVPKNTWTPIGNYEKPFKGTFDGDNHTISGLYFNNSEQKYVGLFGYNSGTIQNVGVEDSYFYGDYYVGGVCGYNQKNATITNCYNTGSVSGNSEYVGGVCGSNEATITNCYNTGSVFGSSDVGGVCGYNEGNATITNCYNTGSVSGEDYVGGVCGYNYYSTITNCYNTGSVSGEDYVGGVCGYNYYSTITNCYNTGSVSGSQRVGGVCGNNDNATITNCYFDSEINNNKNAVGNTQETIDENSVKGFETQKFHSGEVAYLLSHGENGDIWGQDLSDKNSLPCLDKNKKVFIGKCVGNDFYSNTKDDIYESHDYDENGFCTRCDAYQKIVPDENGVYQIANEGQLYWFMKFVNQIINDNNGTNINAKLIKDIVVNKNVLGENNSNINENGSYKTENGEPKYVWTPININYTNTEYSFHFDGDNHTISGLYLNNPKLSGVGLFGSVYGNDNSKIIIENLTIADSYFNSFDFESNNGGGVIGSICGDCYQLTIRNCENHSTIIGNEKVGGIYGYSEESIISNCKNTGFISGKNYVGGIGGENNGLSNKIYGSDVDKCINSGIVTGEYYVGGVCGYNHASSLKECSNSGTIIGTDEVGGVCGHNSGSEFSNNHNSGKVSGKDYVGGVCGNNQNGKLGTKEITSTFSDCYNTETVEGSGNNVGGVCGESYPQISNSYNTGSVSGNEIVGGICGIGKTIYCYNSGEITCINDKVGGITGDGKETISCFNIGKVSGNNYVGGINGKNSYPITNCYNTGSVSGNENVGGVSGNNDGDITNCYNTGSVSGGENSEYVGGVCGYNNADITQCYNNIDFCSNDPNIGEANNITTYQLCSLDIEGLVKGSVSEENGVVTFTFPYLENVGTGYVLDGSFVINYDADKHYYSDETFTINDITSVEYKIGNITFNDKDDLKFSKDNNLSSSNIIKGEYHDYPFTITLNNVETLAVTSIELVENSLPATIVEGDEISEVLVNKIYNNPNHKEDPVKTTSIDNYDKTKVGEQDITIYYNDYKTTVTINVDKCEFNSEVQFNWFLDKTPVVASITLTRKDKPEYTRTLGIEEVSVTSDTIQPTCTEPGTITYTASAKYNNTSYIDTKEIPNGEALGHSYGEAYNLVWASDSTYVTADFKCGDCENELTAVKSSTPVLTSTIPSTTEVKGTKTYTVEFIVDGKTKNAELKVELPLLQKPEDNPQGGEDNPQGGEDNPQGGEDNTQQGGEDDPQQGGEDNPQQVDPDTPTATNEITTQTPTKVWSFNHTIYIEVETPGVEVRIIDLNGRLIKTERLESTNNTITLNREGIVIVIIEGESWKVGLSN